MSNTLFLLCPTDGLESIINTVCKQKNYFYTSLGNSFNTNDFETIEYIKEIVVKHTINEIYFVLSSDNRIVLDALEGQLFSEVPGLKKFYMEIIEQKGHSEVLLRKNMDLFSIFSLYLNKKIKELQFELNDMIYYSVTISGKIYDRNENTFKDLFLDSDLISLEKYYLN